MTTYTKTLLSDHINMCGEFKLKNDTKEGYLEFRRKWKDYYSSLSYMIRSDKKRFNDYQRKSNYGMAERIMNALLKKKEEARSMLILLAMIKAQNRVRIMKMRYQIAA